MAACLYETVEGWKIFQGYREWPKALTYKSTPDKIACVNLSWNQRVLSVETNYHDVRWKKFEFWYLGSVRKVANFRTVLKTWTSTHAHIVNDLRSPLQLFLRMRSRSNSIDHRHRVEDFTLLSTIIQSKKIFLVKQFQFLLEARKSPTYVLVSTSVLYCRCACSSCTMPARGKKCSFAVLDAGYSHEVRRQRGRRMPLHLLAIQNESRLVKMNKFECPC